MKKDPWILRISPNTKPEPLVLYFGELAFNQQNLSIDVIKKCRLRLQNNPDLLAEWNRAIAEEILSISIFNKVNPEIINLFADVSPFQSTKNDDCIPLKMLIEKDKAVAVVPLDGQNLFPAIAHIWLIETEENFNEAEKAPGWKELPLYHKINSKVYKTYTVISSQNRKDIDGNSFKLAIELLKKAIKEKNLKAKKALALDWIITGDVENERVKKVEIGNKTQLRINRNWLIPSDNRLKLSQEFIINQNPKFAHDLSSAFAHITGEGINDSGEATFPGNFTIVHSLVSKAREPAIAAVLLANPKKVVLWHSDNEKESINPANDIKYILNNLGIDCECKYLPDNSIKKAQSIIRKEIENEGNILFSITNGNLLMRLAVFTLSEYFPNIYLIYKELYSPSFEFTGIFYNDAYPTTVKLTKTATQNRIKQLNHKLQNLNWEILFQKNEEKLSNNKKRPLTKEELLEKLINKFKKSK